MGGLGWVGGWGVFWVIGLRDGRRGIGVGCSVRDGRVEPICCRMGMKLKAAPHRVSHCSILTLPSTLDVVIAATRWVHALRINKSTDQ